MTTNNTANDEIKKVAWSTTEVATFFNLSKSLIRFYDANFKISDERRAKRRVFREKALDKLLTILALREEGYTLKGIHRKLGY